MEVVESLGSRIKALRLGHSRTQSDVAEFVGVSKAAISQWELDLAMPQGDNIARLAAHLGVSPDALLWGNSSQAVAINETRLASAISCLESELGSRFANLLPEQKAKLIAYLYKRGDPLPRQELMALVSLVV